MASGKIDPRYKKALFPTIVYQTILGVICSLLLDGGQMAQFWMVSMLAFWVSVIIIIVRNPYKAANLDIGYMRIGYLFVLLVTPFIMCSVWYLRGVLYML